jgi:putative peptidoglycan lipid II flippase
VLTRAFYALGDTRKPVQASFVSVALNLVLNLALMGPLHHLGLALSTSITAIANFLQLAFYLRRKVGPLEGRRMIGTLARVTVASVIALAPSALAIVWLRGRWHGGVAQEAALVAGSLASAIVLGYFAMRALRVAELGALEDAARAIRGRITGR